MALLDLQWEPGVYSRVTAGMALQNSCLFSDVRTLFSCKGHLRILPEGWQRNRDASRGKVRDPVSRSSFHSDIGFPINFQEESVIVSF